MTWDKGHSGRRLSQTGVFFSRRIWIWPIFAILLLLILGLTVRRAIESTMKENLRSQLQTLLDVDTGMLENWAKTQSSIATTLANDLRVRETVSEILAEQDADSKIDSGTAPQKLLRKLLSPTMSAQDYGGFAIVDKERRIVASSHEELVGKQNLAEYDAFLNRPFKGESTISVPFPSRVMMRDEEGVLRTGLPTMFVMAPIRDNNLEVVAVLALRIRPEHEFTRITQMGRFGTSGETYAVDKSGLMVSNSRFDESLMLLGVLPDQEGARSLGTVQVRDPQGDLTLGYRPKVRRSEMPLTKPAADVAAGKSGIDLVGFRDYRGVVSVGAWKWLPEYEMGVITELDAAEAFLPLTILQRTVWTLLALLTCSAIALFVFTVIVARLQRQAQLAEIEAQQLGQYTLERKLPGGGMGVVYKAHHSMLRRETAIKMLDVNKINDEAIARFEHEVKTTSQLNHPNTVAIYDYGRTPEGNFYYAMEYLDGINLQTLVESYGPQPEGRVISILRQVCGSLFEAHSQGLVHRDIKPANIMINRRGAESDVVKVLDFGLVKALDEKPTAGPATANALTGTPLYMAPEAIQTPDHIDGRSDLYALGAVGYYLLTGKTVFEAAGLVELCQMHVEAIPIPPAQRLGKPVSPPLEHAILTCLEKSRNKRPSTARDLAQLLSRCPTANAWTMDEADAWWGRHERRLAGLATTAAVTPVTSSGVFDRTIIAPKPDVG